MVTAEQAVPVNLIIGVLTARKEALAAVIPVLEQHFGGVDCQAGPFPFSVTDYYNRELGIPVQRYFFSFERLIGPADLVAIKHACSEIEDLFRQTGDRRVNLDPGYMDYYKIVLASFKVGGYKIYLGQGVYADMTLMYTRGRFIPFDWGFPDFKAGTYNQLFLKIRTLYKKKLKNSSSSHSVGQQP